MRLVLIIQFSNARIFSIYPFYLTMCIPHSELWLIFDQVNWKNGHEKIISDLAFPLTSPLSNVFDSWFQFSSLSLKNILYQVMLCSILGLTGKENEFFFAYYRR